jgi:hypothetical protein
MWVGLPSSAQAAISAAIGRDQTTYHAKLLMDGSYEMNNPIHNLSAGFSRGAARVRIGEIEWELNLQAWGYGDEIRVPEAVVPNKSENRVEYFRGDLSEWYVNGPQGLEQGFTIFGPNLRSLGLSSSHNFSFRYGLHKVRSQYPLSSDLTLVLSMNYDLAIEMEAGGQGFNVMSREQEEGLHYTGLTAFDARGKVLQSWIEHKPMIMGKGREEILIHVDVMGASYPITVDPWIQKAILTASDKAKNDHFGHVVGIDGDTVVVGADLADPGGVNGAGAAYVFVKPTGGWAGDLTQTAKLTASDKYESDFFGYSVAISGDTVVVGAEWEDPEGKNGAGSAYVFVKPGGGWSGNLIESAKLTASDKQDGDFFGRSVAISGDTLVVGANWEDLALHSGAAYVFVRPGGGWSGNLTESAKLTASDKKAWDHFGTSSGIDGDTIIIGAPSHSTVTDEPGAAYVFVKPGGGWVGNLTESAKLTASDGAADDEFGTSVAVDGNTLIVGAECADQGGVNNVGAAYVFVKTGGGWSGNLTETAKLTASDKAIGDRLGYSVTIDGNTVFVGAPAADIGGATRIYLFEKPGSGWAGNLTENAKLVASDYAKDGYIGMSVSANDKTMVVGVQNVDPDSVIGAGAVYVFGYTSSPSGFRIYLPVVLQ